MATIMEVHTVVDKQSPPIAYLAENSMKSRDFFRILLSFSKDVENTPSEVFPTSN
ncbi:uncharacterized protein LACBIDRAFT_300091 [Laccaria bicolor S238N-H82]|uniref:Predicted protein n=1 Tax=Laccaria bicolor (strain S238N-H82 / ATCC MYA-4686) TaxID=486041 RepID=B0DG03_LACBS|nr:uncharacterized protein LACBIDRAFT_300091 [Laccaria bicolor S238N-H82]EDR06432.1 predicted protein [Laccaria bicolor S238N-H82]|eukprot:XP_001882804.1 predicted protein [Laccaria bicolor S238N-H82]